MEEAVHVLGPDARDILAQIQLYIEEEIYLPENQSPPLGEGFPLTAIRSKARNYRYTYMNPHRHGFRSWAWRMFVKCPD